jgi:hypothetical protein
VAYKPFKLWVEDLEARQIGTKDMIINFLQGELHVTDPDTILNMSTNDIDPSIISKLLSRGLVSTSSQDIIDRIKNGITVQDLIDALASNSSNTPLNPAPSL